jgi:hypothetical protein
MSLATPDELYLPRLVNMGQRDSQNLSLVSPFMLFCCTLLAGAADGQEGQEGGPVQDCAAGHGHQSATQGECCFALA